MNDKMILCTNGLAFDTRPEIGCLTYKDGVFAIDEKRLVNHDRRLLNVGDNYFRVWSQGQATWDGMGQVLAWGHEQYWPLMRQFLRIKHAPYQGDTQPGPGARVGFQLFDGYADKWALSDHAKARKWVDDALLHLADLDFVDIWFGNELDAVDKDSGAAWAALLKGVVIPACDKAGRKLSAYGASICTPHTSGLGGPAERQKNEADDHWGEPVALSMWRQIHNVCDETSEDLRVAATNWLKPRKAQDIRVIISSDGVFKGLSKDAGEGDFVISNGKVQSRPSRAQVRAAIAYWMDSSESLDFKLGGAALGYEYLPKTTDIAIQEKTIAVVADMYKRNWGIDPENVGKWTKDYVEPTVPGPGPGPVTPQPEPENQESGVADWLRRNWGYPVVLIVLMVLAIIIS